MGDEVYVVVCWKNTLFFLLSLSDLGVWWSVWLIFGASGVGGLEVVVGWKNIMFLCFCYQGLVRVVRLLVLRVVGFNLSGG